MRIVLKPKVNRMKNGFAARSLSLAITAHGVSPEIAARNLEHAVLLYLRPFQRQGTLAEELEAAGLEGVGEAESELAVEATV